MIKIISIQHGEEKKNSRTAIAIKFLQTEINQKKESLRIDNLCSNTIACFTKKNKLTDPKFIIVD